MVGASIEVRVDPRLTYQQRIASRQSTALRNGGFGPATVGGDHAANVSIGSSGLDWFWFAPDHDRVTDLHNVAFWNALVFLVYPPVAVPSSE